MVSSRKPALVCYIRDQMFVRTPYNRDFVAALKSATVSRKWNPRTQEWVLDLSEREAALKVIRQFYHPILEEREPTKEDEKQTRRRRSTSSTSSASRVYASEYEVLHLLPTAPLEVVKAAYRSLARLYHPDTSKIPDASGKMKAINLAYEAILKKHVLS